MVKIEDKKKKKSKLFWIIPIVLLISMIILGIYFFVNMDRCCATLKITEFTDAQLRNEINKTFFYDEGKKSRPFYPYWFRT
jgi:cytoskeletal protein RodZ